jgi:hypothetical protein
MALDGKTSLCDTVQFKTPPPFVSTRPRCRIFVTKLRELSKAHVHESLQEQIRRQQQQEQQQQEKIKPRTFQAILAWAEGTTARLTPVCGGGGCKYSVPFSSQNKKQEKEEQAPEANSILVPAGQDQHRSPTSSSSKKVKPPSPRLRHQESLRDFIFGTGGDCDELDNLSFDESRSTTDDDDEAEDGETRTVEPPHGAASVSASSLYTTDDTSYSYSFDDTTTISTWNSRHNAATIAGSSATSQQSFS